MAKAKEHTPGVHHIVSLPALAGTLLLLLILMGITIAASYVEMPSLGPISGNVLNNIVALAIAIVKATLVILVFMGVKWQTNLTKLWVLAGFTWLSLMFMILFDYGTRKYEPAANINPNNRYYPDAWGGGSETALPREPLPADKSLPVTDNNAVNMRPRQ